jgi:pyrimidine-specific ribonucleoside hydrolase
LIAAALAANAQSSSVIVDTDAGSDDLMAIAYLLAGRSVHIEAITVANGLAHVEAGTRNLARLLELAGHPEIPVFTGRPLPLRGKNEFPPDWRKTADDLPGVSLPLSPAKPERRKAADYLLERLKSQDHPVRILALGPLTNIAEVLERDPSVTGNIEELVIMGGAMHVRGNLNDGGVFQTDNKTAEWNMYVDPYAARVVFDSGAKTRLVPLDATNTVPVGAPFLKDIESRASTSLGLFVAKVLETDTKLIGQGLFYAWDPLAAVALVHPAILRTVAVHVEVRQNPPQAGRTLVGAGEPNCRVATKADPDAFRRLFLGAFDK